MKIVVDLIKGTYFHQYLATITGCLTLLCTGMQLGWASPSLPQLLAKNSHIPMTSSDGSWVASMAVLGNIPGSIIGGYIVDKIGRKTTILLTAPIYFLTWIVIAFSESMLILSTGRLCAGIADGLIFTAFPMYIGEISSPDIRGLLGSSIQVSMVAGMLLMNIIGFYFNIKYTALIAAVVPVLHFISFYWMPESPYYLMMRDKTELAKRSLQKLNNSQDVVKEIIRVEDAVKKDKESTGKMWDLFTIESNRKAIYIVFGLRTIQQLCGVTAIMFYVKIIFQETTTSISPSLSTVIYFGIQLVASVISSILVDKTGRRPLLIFSIVGSGFALALEGIYFHIDKNTTYDTANFIYMPLIALLCFCVIFNLGMGTIPVLILGEFFPTNVKAFALCLADIFACIAATVTSKFFQYMRDNFGIHIPFFYFTGWCAICLVFIIFLVPETKGKTLEEIQENLKTKKDVTDLC